MQSQIDLNRDLYNSLSEVFLIFSFPFCHWFTLLLALVQEVMQNISIHLRDNRARGEIDFRLIRSLEYLNADRNAIEYLKISGTSLKTLLVSHNGS